MNSGPRLLIWAMLAFVLFPFPAAPAGGFQLRVKVTDGQSAPVPYARVEILEPGPGSNRCSVSTGFSA